MNFFSKCFIVTTIAFCSFGKAQSAKLGPIKMYIVSNGISTMPNFMVNAWVAKELAQETLNKITNNEDLCLIDLKIPLVTSLNNFLVPARKAKIIVVPLLKESLGENSILVALFNSDQSVEVFFDQKIQEIRDLFAVSNEFVTFFNDLEENLSAQAKASYEQARINFLKNKDIL